WRHFFKGRPARGSNAKDIVWLNPDGEEMTEDEWNKDFARSMGVYLEGQALDEADARGRPVSDDDYLVRFSAHHEQEPFTWPALELEPQGERRRVPLTAHAEGWFEVTVPDARPGMRYAYRIDGRDGVPDPASRANPDDVHGPSMIVDPAAYQWNDEAWQGRPWS